MKIELNHKESELVIVVLLSTLEDLGDVAPAFSERVEKVYTKIRAEFDKTYSY